MKPEEAIAEDLRRLGLLLLAAGIIGGFLKDDVPAALAVYATLVGVAAAIVGYYLLAREHRSSGENAP